MFRTAMYRVVALVLVTTHPLPAADSDKNGPEQRAPSNRGDEDKANLKEVPARRDPAKAGESERQGDRDTKLKFPYQLPNSRTDIDAWLVDQVNALSTESEQIRFLNDLLPAKDAQTKDHKESILTYRQVNAVRLLGLCKSTEAIGPLIDLLGFANKKDGSPAVHALARIGEPAVEPLIKALEKMEDARRIEACVASLSLIKGKEKFPAFVEEVVSREDLRLSKKQIRALRLRAQLEDIRL